MYFHTWWRSPPHPPCTPAQSVLRLFSQTWGWGSFWFQMWIQCANAAQIQYECTMTLCRVRTKAGGENKREQGWGRGQERGRKAKGIRIEGHLRGWGRFTRSGLGCETWKQSRCWCSRFYLNVRPQLDPLLHGCLLIHRFIHSLVILPLHACCCLCWVFFFFLHFFLLALPLSLCSTM